MTIISEVEHTLGDATPATFDKYVEMYGEVAIQALIEVGANPLGAFRQATGPVGRDLMISNFESLTVLEETLGKLMENKTLVEGLPRLMGMGFTIDELSKYGRTLPFADERRIQQGMDNPSGNPRHYRLIRRRADTDGMEAAIYALSDLADGLEAAGSWKLFTAYVTISGDRRELSEMWIADDLTLDWYPEAAPAKALAALDAASLDASIHFLEPLPYSRAR